MDTISSQGVTVYGFSSLEKLAAERPDIYAHVVLSHGFMDYVLANGLDIKAKEKVAGTEHAFCSAMQGRNTGQQIELMERYIGLLKEQYIGWVKANCLHEGLLELGWQEYLTD